MLKMNSIINRKGEKTIVITFDIMLSIAGKKANDLSDKEFTKYMTIYTDYIQGMYNEDSGAYGKMIEKLTRREKSHKLTVARQGKTDATAKIDGKLTGIEVKVNGGRIDGIKEKFVVYSVNVHNSTANKKITARIIRRDTFLTMLELLGATKEVRHNGVVDGIAIQVSNRKLWAWLETMTEYDRTREYSSNEIF